MSGGMIPKKASPSIVNQISLTMRYHKLAARPTYKGRSQTYYLRVWPEGLTLEGMNMRLLTRATQEHIEQQIERYNEIQEKQFVTVNYDLSTIDPPDANPESIMNYLKKVVRCFNRMKDQFDTQQNLLRQTLSERDELKDTLEEMATETAWSDTVDSIQSIIEAKG